MKYKIDASDKILGRLATEIVVLLRGKNQPDFLPYVDSGNSVEVVNMKKLQVSGKKIEQKVYWRYSGYPGGIKKETYEQTVKRDASDILRRAVYGMLPTNRTRAKLMRRLVIK